MEIAILAAIGINKEIGYRGKIPWKISTDLQRFKRLTVGHTVIMGRKTYESMGHHLPNRTNIILSRNPDYHPDNCEMASDLIAGLSKVISSETEAFVIGGAEVYSQALLYATRLYLSRVAFAGRADTYFPNYDQRKWQLTSTETPRLTSKDSHDITYEIYKRV